MDCGRSNIDPRNMLCSTESAILPAFLHLCSPLGYALSYLESLTKYVPNNEVMKYKMRQIAKLKIVLNKHGAETRDPYLEV